MDLDADQGGPKTCESELTSFFKDKEKSKRSHKTVGINFLLFLLDDRRIRILISD
jgi:hypothetical protein